MRRQNLGGGSQLGGGGGSLARVWGWWRQQHGGNVGSGNAAVAARRRQPAWRRLRQLGGCLTAVLLPRFPTRCYCRQSCCCRRASQRAGTANKVALLSSCSLCCQAGRRCRHQAATAALPLYPPPLRCRCLHCRCSAAAATAALLPSCCRRCQAGCRLRGAATTLSPPPPPSFPSSSLSL